MTGERFREARKAKGYKQDVLGYMIGVSGAEISNYENDKKFPPKDKFCKLLDALDVSADYILERETSVASNDTDYIVHLPKRDLEMLSKISEYKELHDVLTSDRGDDIIKKWASKFS